jgi:hypothetical protein
MPDPLSRKESVKAATPTRYLRAAQKTDRDSITRDPRFKQLKAIDKRHIMLLLTWHNPLNGHLQWRTRAVNISERLFVTDETLRTSRWRLIEAGLIVSYVPGSGRRASEYVIARSWAEAEEAAALRRLPDAPHFPELVNRTPSAVNKRPAAAADGDEGQAVETDEGQAVEARERFERARRRRGVTGPVPPELPTAGELDALRERAERETDLDQRNNTIARGVALARAEIKRGSLSTASGAA